MLTHFLGKPPADLWARSPAILLDIELVHEKEVLREMGAMHDPRLCAIR